MNRYTLLAAALGAAALVIPSAAIAKDKPAKPAKPGQSKLVTYVFKGVWNADGTVTVSAGNARVRKGGFVGDLVPFDLAGAKLRAADANADGAVTSDDLVSHKVVVKARLPRTDPGGGPFAATKLVDQSRPAVEEVEEAPVVDGD
jgi:hypothetical protein